VRTNLPTRFGYIRVVRWRALFSRTAARMLFPLMAAACLSTACASILGVDHDYTVGDGAAGDLGIRCADGGTYCPPSQQSV
jgi:hypothetical protein